MNAVAADAPLIQRQAPPFRLVYMSSPLGEWDTARLLGLLDQCRASNLQAGITGLLLYRPDMFMQVLEGDEQAVWSLYHRIEKDDRHLDLTPIMMGNVPARRFDQWSMAFRDLRSRELIGRPGFSELLNMPLAAIPFFTHSSRLEDLLLAFRAHLDEPA